MSGFFLAFLTTHKQKILFMLVFRMFASSNGLCFGFPLILSENSNDKPFINNIKSEHLILLQKIYSYILFTDIIFCHAKQGKGLNLLIR